MFTKPKENNCDQCDLIIVSWERRKEKLCTKPWFPMTRFT